MEFISHTPRALPVDLTDFGMFRSSSYASLSCPLHSFAKDQRDCVDLLRGNFRHDATVSYLTTLREVSSYPLSICSSMLGVSRRVAYLLGGSVLASGYGIKAG